MIKLYYNGTKLCCFYRVQDIKIDPNPPRKGEDMHVDFKGYLKEQVGEGAQIDVIVKYGAVRYVALPVMQIHVEAIYLIIGFIFLACCIECLISVNKRPKLTKNVLSRKVSLQPIKL